MMYSGSQIVVSHEQLVEPTRGFVVPLGRETVGVVGSAAGVSEVDLLNERVKLLTEMVLPSKDSEIATLKDSKESEIRRLEQFVALKDQVMRDKELQHTQEKARLLYELDVARGRYDARGLLEM